MRPQHTALTGLFLTLILELFLAPNAFAAEKNTANNAAATSSTEEASGYFSLEELKIQGHKISAVETQPAPNSSAHANQFLVCSKLHPADCICLEPLPCEGNNTCIKFADNVGALEEALKKPGKNTLFCQYADIGMCGDFRYLNFAGDMQRREMRWFNAAGTLVGQRNATDYPAYCNGMSKVLYQGKIPKCAVSVQERSICGEPWAHNLTPLQTLGLEDIPPKKTTPLRKHTPPKLPKQSPNK
jgi:hypothetical protein